MNPQGQQPLPLGDIVTSISSKTNDLSNTDETTIRKRKRQSKARKSVDMLSSPFYTALKWKHRIPDQCIDQLFQQKKLPDVVATYILDFFEPPTKSQVRNTTKLLVVHKYCKKAPEYSHCAVINAEEFLRTIAVCRTQWRCTILTFQWWSPHHFSMKCAPKKFEKHFFFSSSPKPNTITGRGINQKHPYQREKEEFLRQKPKPAKNKKSNATTTNSASVNISALLAMMAKNPLNPHDDHFGDTSTDGNTSSNANTNTKNRNGDDDGADFARIEVSLPKQTGFAVRVVYRGCFTVYLPPSHVRL